MKQALINCLQSFEQEFASAIVSLLEKQNWVGFLSAKQSETLCTEFGLSAQQLALKLLPLAACYAHTPISHFNVGAIAIGESGNFYFGANQEFSNTPMSQTIHAEQSAISHAWLRNETRIAHMVVNYTPCGHCRQFMQELYQAEQIQIHLPHSQNNLLSQYLTDAFGPKNLNVERLLLQSENHQLLAENADPLVNLAIEAANQSHCPYSLSPHGVAILLNGGGIVTGRYAENAAFNPSLPALQTAINYLYLSNISLSHIKRVIMAEKVVHNSHKVSAENLLSSLTAVKLEYFSL